MGNLVRLEYHDSIGLVTMEDRKSRNTFTQEFVEDLKTVFGTIEKNESLRCVVVQGYDNYFCCGGSQEELLRLRSAIEQDLGKFSDLQFFDVFLQCPIPVIASLHGHAIGGGLALALFADVVVLAEECIYSANFMRYGFTPGMGITETLPNTMGPFLGREMLLTAGNYYGADLKKRGAPVKIVSKTETFQVAWSIAKELAEKPRLSLVTLKNHLTKTMKNNLSRIVEEEAKMHKQTFLQDEVLENIRRIS